MPPDRPLAIVWGNCQAEPIGAMLSAPLAAQGFEVRQVPPVYLVTEAELVEVRQLVARCSLLVTQPVRPEYRMPGTGSEAMIALAPAAARVVHIPVTYDSTEFPFQVVGHGAVGEGVFAPMTAYHDLRLMIAAEQGWDVAKVLEWWSGTVEAAALRRVSERSLTEMRRREADVDVSVSEVLGQAGAMFTVNHPSNLVLTRVANGVLQALGFPPSLTVDDHEELSHTRTALEVEVLRAHRWSEALASPWQVGGKRLRLDDIAAWHLEFYTLRPDVIADAHRRHEEQIALLGL